MTLRRKLLLVALCTLALPIAGWLYVRQMEMLLREGQEQALVASARAVARSLVVTHAPLPQGDTGWYVQEAANPITVDGYGDDWAPLTPWSQPLGGRGKLLLAEDKDWLYLYVDVRSTHRTRADAGDANALAADHLILGLDKGGQQRRYLLASMAPGPVTARPLDPPAQKLPDLIVAQWQEDGSGYRIELRLPRSLALDGLGVGVHDASTNAGDDPQSVEIRPLLSYSGVLSKELAQLAPDNVRARVLAPQGWLLARSGRLGATAATVAEQPGWFASMVYRLLLANRLESAEPWTDEAPRLDVPEVKTARNGSPATLWRRGEARGSVVLAAAVPIGPANDAQGVLLLEQASRAVPLLANRALLGLLAISFGVLLVAGAILLAFATRLSIRLARLRDAAERAQANDGRLDGQMLGKFPMTDAEDEIGDLARSFERLLEVVGGYTDYLRTLASKLSHELNTPLAIVKSSLDNLEHAALPADAVPYLARARDGVARLGTLVRAMSEATRMERAIAAAEPEDVDLVEVVRGCAEAYRPLAGARRLDCVLPDGPLRLHCAPELIAQALDKLFDNALSFTPETGWLRLSLRASGDGAEIELANQGAPLPAAMHGRLFDSLVSLRDKATPGDAPHLGLGLYVVRLVAERHHGVALARNLEDGSGVAFVLRLQGMPRQRL
ncbi:dedicated sortase system histidine kinase [Dyella sp. OK004]|uniref:ATP-binding protein n=1 Tax=Dyella sp. OK004 TaxID=1855292 RepID=UPI0008EFDF72|nr:ATP-binding protein [Dyella sp. OK004]SFR91697.1 dedicated sortase system histidine kinase [Dyella sp. OK004]